MTSDHQPQPQNYEVSIGHATVLVKERGIPEAIAAARKLLCQELPRMWDVIHALDPQRFQVRLLTSH